MKKVMMIAALAAALVSCQSKGTQNNDAVAMDESVMAVTGSVGPDGESGYTLVTTYLDAEGPGKNKSFTSKGKKEVIQKDVDNKKKTAIKLTPNDGDTPVYFVVVNDTTLRLVNDSLQEAVSDLNYDIIQVNSVVPAAVFSMRGHFKQENRRLYQKVSAIFVASSKYI